MRPNQDLFDVTSSALLGLREVIKKAAPDVVLVQGDTTTSMSGALAAFYLQVPVGHIEAGLRTHNLATPFPEEGNRAIVGRLARWHFAPTEQSKANLLREGIDPATVYTTGNTVIDALQWMHGQIKDRRDWAQHFGPATEVMNQGRNVILVTGHRRESFGEGFKSICRSVARIARERPNWSIVYPVHLNPNVQAPVKEILAGIPNVYLIQPLEYPAFVYAMSQSRVILSDSGGVQEEAPSLGKPVLIMRETTERPEALSAGTSILVGTSEAKIYEHVMELMTNCWISRQLSHLISPKLSHPISR